MSITSELEKTEETPKKHFLNLTEPNEGNALSPSRFLNE
jgi:hypothetical protein